MPRFNPFLFFHLYLATIIIICSTDTTAQQLTKTTFGVNSPLGTQNIFDIHFSADNLLYIATSNGFWSYDGLNFHRFKQSVGFSNQTHSIQENTSGEIFAADFHGNVFQLQNDSLIPYPVDIQEKIEHFLIQKDYTYYLTTASIYAQSNSTKKIQKVALPKELYDVRNFSDYGYFYGRMKDKPAIWGLIQDTTLIIKGQGYRQKRFCNDHNNEFLNFDPSARYIVNSEQDTIADLEKAPRELTTYKLKKFDNQTFIMCREGLYLPKTNQLFLENHYVNEVLTDHENNTWISTVNRGLHKVANFKQVHYPLPTPNTTVDFAYIDQNNAICSDKTGKLYTWDKSKRKFAQFYEKETKGPVKSINYYSAEQQYIFSGNQVVLFDKDLNFTHSIPGRRGIHLDGKSIPYQRTPMGYFFPYFPKFHIQSSVDKEQTLLHETKEYGFYKRSVSNHDFLEFKLKPDKSIRGLCFFNDNILTAFKGGLFVISSNDYQVKKKIPIPNVQKFYFTNNRLFVLTPDKIIEFDSDGNILREKTRLDELKNKPNAITADDQHICILIKNVVYLFDANTFKYLYRFSSKNGIASSKFDNIWLYNQDLYINGNNGLSHIPLNGHYKKDKATIAVAKVLVNGKEQIKTSFAYDQNDIEIALSVRSYSSKGFWKWRLNNKTWNQSSHEVPYIRLNQLKAGTYSIEAYFENELAIRSDIVVYNFTINSPFWQRWWFYLLILFGGSAILGGFFWLHMNTKRKEEGLKSQNNLLRMQALQTQMNPHFIFNVQAAIQGTWLRGDETAALSLQNKFSKLLRKIFQYSGQASISIEQLVDFLENYISLERIRFKNKVEINFQVDPSLTSDDFFIPPLLVQPIIENSFKHGLLHRETNRLLFIDIKNQDPYLYCVIEDNGIGRQIKEDHPTKNQKRASGLETTKNRLSLLQENIIKKEHLHQNIRITDLKDELNQATGTKVELWIPFVDFQEI